MSTGEELRTALNDTTVDDILVEANLQLPAAWDSRGEDVTRPLVIRGDVAKCGRPRCTLDAGANSRTGSVFSISLSQTSGTVVLR